jgi:acetolactate synthase-1/2/3 large subunit
MEYRNGGELLVSLLREHGVDAVFGVVSVHNLPLVEAVNASLRFVPVRHEAAAVNAADGYSRATGGLGCAITSTGTGAGNAAGSMVEALTAGSRLLHVTTTIPTEHLDRGRGFIHEFVDQPAMLEAVSSWYRRIPDVESAPAVLSEAVASALGTPGGPATVEWPIDLQYGAGRTPPATPPAPAAAAEPQGLDEAVRLVRGARRRLLWAGGGALGAAPAIRALAERLGMGVLTSNAGRGVVPEDHPLCVGNYGTSPAGQGLLDEADLLVSIGSHFRSNETNTYKLRLPVAHIQIDVDRAAIGRCYPVSVGLEGDAGAVVASLDRALGETTADPAWVEAVMRARLAARQAQRRAISPYAHVCDAIRNALPREGIIARDVTIPSSSWGNRLLDVYDHRSNVFARGGGIGQGVAMGLGAAIGRADVPTLVMVGDGGLAVHLGELLTVAQEAPDITIVVFNDRGYGVLRNVQLDRGAPPAGVDLLTPDFAGLASAVGLAHWRVERASEASGAIAEAVRHRGPSLVEVDVDAVGPMSAPFTPPVDVPEEWS